MSKGIKDTKNKVLEKLHLKENPEFSANSAPKREVTTVHRSGIPHSSVSEGTSLASFEKKSHNAEIQELLNLFGRAVDLDHAQKHEEAFKIYMDALDRVVPLLRSIEEESLKNALKGQVVKYMTRTEELKVIIANNKKQVFPQIPNTNLGGSSGKPPIPDFPSVPTSPKFSSVPSSIPSPSFPVAPSFPSTDELILPSIPDQDDFPHSGPLTHDEDEDLAIRKRALAQRVKKLEDRKKELQQKQDRLEQKRKEIEKSYTSGGGSNSSFPIVPKFVQT